MNPKDTTTDVQRAVDYLERSDEPIDSNVSVVANAAQSADVPVETILEAYAESLSSHGVIYPMHESKLRDLHSGLKQKLGENAIDTLPEICHPNKLIKTKDDVITEAINIYSQNNESKSEKQEQIKTLIKDAQRDGIDIDPDDVLRSLKEFTTTADETGSVSVDMEDDMTLVTNIETPDQVTAGEEYIYRAVLEDDANITDTDWYIGGTKKDSGRTALHTFEFPGIYTVSVEVTDTEGQTDHASIEVEVNDPSTLDLNIAGRKSVAPGTTVDYRAEVVARNETVKSIDWELDAVPAGEGQTFSNTFEHDGEHTIAVTVTGESGVTVTESKDITVQTPTGIDVDLDVPDEVFVDEKIEIESTIDVTNSSIDSTTFKIGDEVIPIEEASSIVVEHIFTEVGEYPVTITATTTTGETDTGVATVNARVKPEVNIIEQPNEVIRGDSDSFRIEYDDRLSSRWGVTDASLMHVGDRTAQVQFNSGLAENARVTIEVENGAGEVGSDSATVKVKQPTVDTVIDCPTIVTVDELVEFSATETVATDADITRIEWTLGDGTVIGRGETVTHRFTAPSEYTVSATTHTDRDVGDTETVTVTVEPDTDLTAVVVTGGGPSTRDEFEFDASKSVADNTDITSYTWDIENHDEKVGESTTARFESPGEYDVELTVETQAGDVDTDTDTVSVEQFTNVTATIDGPSDFGIGEPIEFSGEASVPINTHIVEYEWFLNDQPSGSGKSFTQTFSDPGHYTVALQVTTATGDTDRVTKGVVAESPESTVNPAFDLKLDKQPAVGEPVTITAAPTEVDNGTPRAFEWVVDDNELGNTTAVIGVSFERIGEVQIQLTVTASDGVTETITKTVYVTPPVFNPPYTPIDTDSETADVLASAVEVYQNDRLTVDDKNRFAAHLIKDAKKAGIYLDAEEVVEHLADIDAVNNDTVDIHVTSVDEERKYRFVDEDAHPSEKYREYTESATWNVENDTEGTSHGPVTELEAPNADPFDIKAETDQPTRTQSDPNEPSPGQLDIGYKSDETKKTGHDRTTSPESPIRDTTFGVTDPQLHDDDPDPKEKSTLDDRDDEDLINTDDLHTVDEDEAYDDDRHKQERISPETYDLGDSIFSMPNYAQDIMDFEYIMGEDDALVPDGANGAGIVVAENDTYIGIARISGRDWSIHTGDKQHGIVQTYQQHFLTALDSPVQIVSVPTRFDMREHIQMVNETIQETSDDKNELLMNIGRSVYPNWLENFMAQNDMKERQFYLVVAVSAKQLHQFKGDGESLIEQLTEVPVIGNFFKRFSNNKVEDITKYQCLRELNTRIDRMKAGLRRMDIEAQRIDNRNEAMSVLYHYYHNIEPDREVFPTGPFTTTEQNGSIGGISVDHLLDEHMPAHGGLDGDVGDNE